jgi:hypothetical protein
LVGTSNELLIESHIFVGQKSGKSHIFIGQNLEKSHIFVGQNLEKIIGIQIQSIVQAIRASHLKSHEVIFKTAFFARNFSLRFVFADVARKKIKISILKPGTDVMIIKIFSPKNSTNKMAVLTQNKAELC